MIKAYNGYAGIGGNRKLWKDVEVTAVEQEPDIAAIYQELYPDDKVIVGDAHEYLLQHFREFDFAWTSTPCITHTRLRLSHPNNVVYPDMRLWQEIKLLRWWFKGKWCVENVEPYYDINKFDKPTAFLDRHYFWTNFRVTDYRIGKANKDVSRDTLEGLQQFKGIDLSRFDVKEKRLLLRNAVHPKLGLHIFNCAFKEKQHTIDTYNDD
jgi:DNA (cytosine-5)-methyltransferase 1